MAPALPEAPGGRVRVRGHFAPWKRQHHALAACARLLAQRPTLAVCVVGGATGPDQEAYRSRTLATARAALGEALHVEDAVPDPRPWIEAADVLLLASEAEPFGRVLLEAMARRKPVVACRGGGPLTIVDEGVTGHLVPPDDVTAMATALGTALDRKRAYGAAGRARLEARFTLAALAAAFTDWVAGTGP